MGFRELNIGLTDEQKATRDMVRKFGVKVMRPAGIELDKLHDPQDVVAKGSVLWDVFRKHRELDLHRRVLPAAVGGLEQDPLTGALVAEGDITIVGLAISTKLQESLRSPVSLACWANRHSAEGAIPPLTSVPEQKAGSSPVRISALTTSSRFTSSSASLMRLCISQLTAFRLSGRFRVMVAIPASLV